MKPRMVGRTRLRSHRVTRAREGGTACARVALLCF